MCLQSKTLFERYCSKSSQQLSSYHFSAVFAWKDFFNFTFEAIDGYLCIFAHQGRDAFLYLPPLGKPLEEQVIEECFCRMGTSKIARVENISDNQLPLFQAKGYNIHLKAHEYVYKRSDLEKLEGHAYKSKRHDIHVFQSHYPKAHYRPLQSEDQGACLNLYRHWQKNRQLTHADPVYLSMLEENSRVHGVLIGHADDLGLVGRVVELDGQIIAYTLGYAIDAHHFCVALEITDLDKNGCAAYIFQSFCGDDALKQFQWINAMDDFGIPNVALAKESYRPAFKMPVYTAQKRN